MIFRVKIIRDVLSWSGLMSILNRISFIQTYLINEFWIEIGKRLNPLLLSALKEKDELELFNAIRVVFIDEFMSYHGNFQWPVTDIGLSTWMKILEELQRKDPKSLFIFLLQIYALLSTKETLVVFLTQHWCHNSDELEDLIFQNPNFHLQFRQT